MGQNFTFKKFHFLFGLNQKQCIFAHALQKHLEQDLYPAVAGVF